MATNTRKSLVAILQANNSLIMAGLRGQISSRLAPPEFTGVWIRFQKVSNAEEGAMDGHQGLSRSRWQFDVSSTDEVKVSEIVNILIKEFNAQSYTAFAGTDHEQTITFFHEDDVDVFEEAPRIFMGSVDLILLTETT